MVIWKSFTALLLIFLTTNELLAGDFSCNKYSSKEIEYLGTSGRLDLTSLKWPPEDLDVALQYKEYPSFGKPRAMRVAILQNGNGTRSLEIIYIEETDKSFKKYRQFQDDIWYWHIEKGKKGEKPLSLSSKNILIMRTTCSSGDIYNFEILVERIVTTLENYQSPQGFDGTNYIINVKDSDTYHEFKIWSPISGDKAYGLLEELEKLIIDVADGGN